MGVGLEDPPRLPVTYLLLNFNQTKTKNSLPGLTPPSRFLTFGYTRKFGSGGWSSDV